MTLVSLSEGGGATGASAAEIRAIRTLDMECVKTIQINVTPIIIYNYNDAWTTDDPNGLSTSNDIIKVISGEAVIFSNTSVYDLIVEPGAALTVNPGVTLSAKKAILNSTSGAYSSLIIKGEFEGEVNYNRYVNIMGTSAGGGNDLVSSPVKGEIFNYAFTERNSNLPQHPDERKRGEYAFAPYNVITGAYENYNIGIYGMDDFELVSGIGYRVATTDGSTLTFIGAALKENVDVIISDALEGKAWNLIGNPYPSYINFKAFFDENINEFESGDAYQAVYGYTGKSDSDSGLKWEVLNSATTSEETLMAPGQGFFVKAKSNGGNVQFTPEMRRTGKSDDFIEGRPFRKNVALSKLKLTSANKNGLTSIYFIEGTTRGLDSGYDAGVFTGAKVDFSIFTNLLEDHTGIDIAVQSLPYEDFNDVSVPLGIKAKAGAELSISIDDLSTIPSNINVYLEDIQNNTLNLLNNDAYTFTPSFNLNGATRFNVHYSSRTLSVSDMDANANLRIYTTVVPKVLVISGQLTSATTAHLYDIQGRLVLRKVLNPYNTENSIDISTIGTGVYVVKLVNDNQIKTQKLVIK